MGLVDVTRHVVVRTNRWPVVGAFYDRVYDVGLSFSAARLAAVPGVLAVLQRVNEPHDGWSPGLSDYDLTIVTAPHAPARAVPFLDDLWRRYRSIKRLVPPLGEVDVFDLDEYADLLDFGPMPTWSLKRARPLAVNTNDAAVVRLIAREGRARGPHDVLLDAITRFGRYFFPAWLADARLRTGLTRQRAEHLLANVVKRLDYLGVGVERPAVGSPSARVAAVLLAIARACDEMPAPPPADCAVVDPEVVRLPDDVEATVRHYCEEIIRDADVPEAGAIVWVSYMTAASLTLAFIAPDDVGENALVRLLDAVARRQASVPELFLRLSARDRAHPYTPAIFPVVATAAMWRCWRNLSPFDSLAVAANGRTLAGTQPLGAGPSYQALVRGSEARYAAILPAKNNWLRLEDRAVRYPSVVNHANGCASVFSGRAMTAPVPIAFSSIEDGYRAACSSLVEVRRQLRSRM